jgi:hypothetical protein
MIVLPWLFMQVPLLTGGAAAKLLPLLQQLMVAAVQQLQVGSPGVRLRA